MKIYVNGRTMEVDSVRLPDGWKEWIKKHAPKIGLTPSKFKQNAILSYMWENGYDPGRKEKLHDPD